MTNENSNYGNCGIVIVSGDPHVGAEVTHCTVLGKKDIHMDGDCLWLRRPDNGRVERFNIDTEAMMDLINSMASIVSNRAIRRFQELESLVRYIKSETVDKEESE